MSAQQVRAGSWSTRNPAKILRSVSTARTVAGRNDTSIWSR
jgi:hypothetical protein